MKNDCDPFNFHERRPLAYRNQSIDLQGKSLDWFLYGRDLHHERVNGLSKEYLRPCETCKMERFGENS